ncbi:unnamed protein product [Periconia digitata]|uniref:RING-type E3 ubiquitin transferase n=1 Tax=Periconia digitata TaxID=1303443 RepID=A0A9W4UDS6_9PLEO|nr:unnamed protein product [Periconia digitata]
MASTPARSTQPAGRREMMFCHECHDEWYRDEKGIICPECQSEFTEIIEDDNDPRDNFERAHDDDSEDDFEDSLPSLEEASASHHPLHHHNPWAEVDDPDEADISSMRFQPTGPGRFHVQATIHRTISPAQFGVGGTGANSMGAFQSLLANLIQGAQPPHTPRDGLETDGQSESRPGGDEAPRFTRFTYSSNAHLHPRDDNHPEPRNEPVDDINGVMNGLFQLLGETPGVHHAGPGQSPFGDIPPNPLMGLFAAISGGQHGDAVYSQEALDRIVSQLMEQTATSNAPGPASQEDIDALPRKLISEDMLGAEHRAECSICMDEVNIGEEVTELPCKHWFHHHCVAAWLSEHNTCPHCRKGIKGEETSSNAQQDGNRGSAATSGSDPTSSMPGAFGATSEGVSNNPNSNPAPGQDGGSGGPGLGDRLRRGWFGSQQD